MKQMRLATGFELATKRTRKREFLDELKLVVPLAELVSLIELHAPSDKTGRPPFAVSTLLRIHFMRQWFGLSDPAMEEVLHDVPLYFEFAGLDAGISRLPDESTILGFCHLLAAHDLSLALMATINATLATPPRHNTCRLYRTKNSGGEREGYAISQQKRKLIEQGFGWAKTVGRIRQVMVRGLEKVDQLFVLTMAAYNLTLMRTLGQIRLQTT